MQRNVDLSLKTVLSLLKKMKRAFAVCWTKALLIYISNDLGSAVWNQSLEKLKQVNILI